MTDIIVDDLNLMRAGDIGVITNSNKFIAIRLGTKFEEKIRVRINTIHPAMFKVELLDDNDRLVPVAYNEMNFGAQPYIRVTLPFDEVELRLDHFKVRSTEQATARYKQDLEGIEDRYNELRAMYFKQLGNLNDTNEK